MQDFKCQEIASGVLNMHHNHLVARALSFECLEKGSDQLGGMSFATLLQEPHLSSQPFRPHWHPTSSLFCLSLDLGMPK